MPRYVIGDYQFSLVDKIGRGAYSDVYEGYDKKKGRQVAIKIIDYKKFKKCAKQLRREIDIMKLLFHENIIELYDYYIAKAFDTGCGKYLYIIMEYCEGGDLSKLEAPISESDWRCYFKQIISAMKYLRDMNIVHRDIKPENILLTKNGIVKLADFTFARQADALELMNTFCGTGLYMAPELFLNPTYTSKSDIWSLGVLMYIYIYNKHPFGKIKNQNDLRLSYENSKINFPKLTYNKYKGGVHTVISSSCLDLMISMLTKNVDDRIDWDDLYNHPWLNMSPKVAARDNDGFNKNRNLATQSMSAPDFNRDQCNSLLIPPAINHDKLVDKKNTNITKKNIDEYIGISKSGLYNIANKEIHIEKDYMSESELIFIPSNIIDTTYTKPPSYSFSFGIFKNIFGP